MKPQIITQFGRPHLFEPLLPADSVQEPLRERASDLSRAPTSLGNTAGQTTQLELRKTNCKQPIKMCIKLRN
jgi:hypothetical protein